jgi:hypothetical protein
MTGIAIRSRSGTCTFNLRRNGVTVMSTPVTATPVFVPLDIVLADGDQLRVQVTNPAGLDSLYFTVQFGA